MLEDVRIAMERDGATAQLRHSLCSGVMRQRVTQLLLLLFTTCSDVTAAAFEQAQGCTPGVSAEAQHALVQPLDPNVLHSTTSILALACGPCRYIKAKMLCDVLDQMGPVEGGQMHRAFQVRASTYVYGAASNGVHSNSPPLHCATPQLAGWAKRRGEACSGLS